MSLDFEVEKPISGLLSNPSSPLKKRKPPNWSTVWRNNSKSLNQMIFTMHLKSLSNSTKNSKTENLISSLSNINLFSDELLLQILAKLPISHRNTISLVCKRWLYLQGRLARSLKVLDWEFLESGRLISRFPNLIHVDLVSASFTSPTNSSILLNDKLVSMQIGSVFSPISHIHEENLFDVGVIDRGVKALANGCPNLRKLVVIGASELGLLTVAEECPMLQELELHMCNDNILRGIAACENLQILKLVGNVVGFFNSLVSDIGLTIIAGGCRRLVKLELCGCEGSFDGIKAIGQCCQMLEELTLSDHRMESGWLAGISSCENLKSLRILSSKRIDLDPGPDEYLGLCPALERFHLQNCRLRDKKSVRALFMVCGFARDVVIQDCWGLDNDMFRSASYFRRARYLSIEGCSLLTNEGLEYVVIGMKELQSLRVVSCKNVKEMVISPALSTVFSVLKDLIWRPDTKSLLPSSIAAPFCAQFSP